MCATRDQAGPGCIKIGAPLPHLHDYHSLEQRQFELVELRDSMSLLRAIVNVSHGIQEWGNPVGDVCSAVDVGGCHVPCPLALERVHYRFFESNAAGCVVLA